MHASSVTRVSAPKLRSLVEDVFIAAGLSRRAAEVTAGSLVQADMQGLPSHGVQLLPMYLDRISIGSVATHEALEVLSDRGAVVVADAAHALGQATAPQATEMAVQKAREHGVGAVSVRNAFHLGALRQYACEIADEGCVGIVMTNTRPMMPPPGGSSPVVGNNPLAIAVPRYRDKPVVADMAFSAVAIGKIRMAAAEGERIPNSWATDAGGQPTSDPHEAISGMLQSVGGPKGFGLAMMVDLLAGGLSGGGVGKAIKGLYEVETRYNSSQLFIALNIAHFTKTEMFDEQVGTLMEGIERAGGRVPGSRSSPTGVEKADFVELSNSTLGSIGDAAQSLGIAHRLLEVD